MPCYNRKDFDLKLGKVRRNHLFRAYYVSIVVRKKALLVLLVNESKYSQSKGAKPILSPSCIYFVFRARAAALRVHWAGTRPTSTARAV
jgi:hypothetical protein